MTRRDWMFAAVIAVLSGMTGYALAPADRDRPAPAPAALTETCNQTGRYRIVTFGTSIAMYPDPTCTTRP